MSEEMQDCRFPTVAREIDNLRWIFRDDVVTAIAAGFRPDELTWMLSLPDGFRMDRPPPGRGRGPRDGLSVLVECPSLVPSFGRHVECTDDPSAILGDRRPESSSAGHLASKITKQLSGRYHGL